MRIFSAFYTRRNPPRLMLFYTMENEYAGRSRVGRAARATGMN